VEGGEGDGAGPPPAVLRVFRPLALEGHGSLPSGTVRGEEDPAQGAQPLGWVGSSAPAVGPVVLTGRVDDGSSGGVEEVTGLEVLVVAAAGGAGADAAVVDGERHLGGGHVLHELEEPSSPLAGDVRAADETELESRRWRAHRHSGTGGGERGKADDGQRRDDEHDRQSISAQPASWVWHSGPGPQLGRADAAAIRRDRRPSARPAGGPDGIEPSLRQGRQVPRGTFRTLIGLGGAPPGLLMALCPV
jgi:hypothetical protein